ncbi:SHOCT domain-containing protein [Lysinibacillus fusiformis]|uniref:SHOCT domain-containing protein n=1 Tax=Lysinibacillus fusiformis TaxID=28031 RepID=UPI002EC36CC9|nr:SHOCT domain-containing protein [Lysinibacillus fusiformis]
MYAVEQIKEYLKPEGWVLLNNFKKEINLIAEQVDEDEIVEGVAILVRGIGGLKQYLGVLTSKRFLTTDKQKKFIGFNFNDIHKFTTNKKITSSEINFAYNTEAISINILSDDLGKRFLKELQDKLSIPSNVPTENNNTETRQIVRVMKAIKMNIEILNGKEQLNQNGSGYKLAQTKPGTVEISVDYHDAETFKLVKWERVENVQKSVSSIVGWTVIGSKFGNAGAIAGAMGANVGKDKSVATLFLKRENGEKVPLVIKCDKKDLEKLSLLIVAEEEETTQTAVTPPSTTTSIPTDELIKLKELMDAGILTQEEFDAKKKQLLGI